MALPAHIEAYLRDAEPATLAEARAQLASARARAGSLRRALDRLAVRMARVSLGCLLLGLLVGYLLGTARG